MSDQEKQMLAEIAVKVGRLEVLQESNAKAIHDMAVSVNRLVEKLDKSDDIAREADQRAKSAHHRIDEANKRMDGFENDVKWLWRTIITAIITGVIGGAVTLFWKSISS